MPDLNGISPSSQSQGATSAPVEPGDTNDATQTLQTAQQQTAQAFQDNVREPALTEPTESATTPANGPSSSRRQQASSSWQEISSDTSAASLGFSTYAPSVNVEQNNLTYKLPVSLLDQRRQERDKLVTLLDENGVRNDQIVTFADDKICVSNSRMNWAKRFFGLMNPTDLSRDLILRSELGKIGCNIQIPGDRNIGNKMSTGLNNTTESAQRSVKSTFVDVNTLENSITQLENQLRTADATSRGRLKTDLSQARKELSKAVEQHYAARLKLAGIIQLHRFCLQNAAREHVNLHGYVTAGMIREACHDANEFESITNTAKDHLSNNNPNRVFELKITLSGKHRENATVEARSESPSHVATTLQLKRILPTDKSETGWKVVHQDPLNEPKS